MRKLAHLIALSVLWVYLIHPALHAADHHSGHQDSRCALCLQVASPGTVQSLPAQQTSFEALVELASPTFQANQPPVPSVRGPPPRQIF